MDDTLLPETVKTWIAVIGLPATFRLVNQFGGTVVTLSGSERNIEAMAEALGKEAADALFRFMGAAPFTVPLCTRALKAVRNNAIHGEFDRLTITDGLSAREAVSRISRQYAPHLHERSVWRILNLSTRPTPVDIRQMSLI